MSKQRKIHLFNCDHTYKLDAVENWMDTAKSKLGFDLTMEKHYFSLLQMTVWSNKTIPELDMDVAVFAVHAHESRLSINEENAGIGYAKIYRALLQKTDGKVIIVIGGDDSYKDKDEEDRQWISRWARRKISSQFSEEFMDGRKSFIFSWDKKHREIHEKALLHFFDPSKKGEKFEYQPPKRQLPPRPTTPPPVRPSEPEASSRLYSSLPETPYAGERVQSTKPFVPVESRAHRISDQGPRPRERGSSNTETEDLAILGCSVSEASIRAVKQEIKKIGPNLNLKKDPPVKNRPPAEIKQYLERNWLKFCVLVVDAESVQDVYANLPKRRDEYKDLLRTAVDRVAEKIIVLVCDDNLLLPQRDEEIVHQTIYRIVKERGKGFIAWLKSGKLTVDFDILAQFLLSSKPTMGHMMPQSSPPSGSQGKTNVLSFSATESRQTYMDQPCAPVAHPLEPEARYWLENIQQPQGVIQQSNPPANTTYNRHSPSTGKLLLKSKLRYGKISYDKSRDLKILSPEFQGVDPDTAHSLWIKYGNIAETQVMIVSDPKDNTVVHLIAGDLGIAIADNETLMLKTRVCKGLVSFHEDNLEVLYPGFMVPVHILEDLKRKVSEAKLFIIIDEKGNLRCRVQSGVKDKAVAAKDKAVSMITSRLKKSQK